MVDGRLHDDSIFSRLLSKMEKHDTGTITAFRGENTRKENEARNRLLARDLLHKGYRFTEVAGTYIENYDTPNAREVKENSFFVEDYRDTGNLRSDLIKLSQKYDQDSVMFIPRIGTASEKAILIGTSDAPDSYPGLGKTVKFTGRGFGSPAEFMTKISGRPFTFSERVIKDYANPMTMMGKWAKSEIERRQARGTSE